MFYDTGRLARNDRSSLAKNKCFRYDVGSVIGVSLRRKYPVSGNINYTIGSEHTNC